MAQVLRDLKCNFLSLNVKGIREKNKRERIFAWCREKQADIIFLQETLKINGNPNGMGVVFLVTGLPTVKEF